MAPGEEQVVEYLDLQDFLLIAEAVLGVPADTLARNQRTVAAAESALAAPRAGFGGVEQYPELYVKAAVLCSRICRNHPLTDGNKRTAFLCLVEFIERNGGTVAIDAADDDVVTDTVVMIERLAAGSLSEPDFITWVHGRAKW